ncbi:hypothetical protein SAMN05518865_10392 [Duganella sp. CF458]|jgi:hypothetical protein|nr:hypothetical protein SAMN05518865_10392 [Duganella sp. CF458]
MTSLIVSIAVVLGGLFVAGYGFVTLMSRLQSR